MNASEKIVIQNGVARILQALTEILELADNHEEQLELPLNQEAPPSSN